MNILAIKSALSEQETEHPKKDIKDKEHNNLNILMFIIYLLASVSGMMLFKLGTDVTNFSLSNGVLGFYMPWYSILGMVLYVVSFILWMFLLNSNNVSYIYPIAVGLSQILVLLGAMFILKEDIQPLQWIGIIIVIVGIALINYKK